MSKATAKRLLSEIPGASRRQQYSASTRRALVEAARELFTERGYAATSLDAIVSQAKVTKGALYHHYSGKQALFEAVFEQVEQAASKTITRAVRGSKDPWEKASAGLRAFLEAVQEPGYRRVVMQEGPAVLGHERYREQEQRSSYAIVLDIVRNVLRAGDWELDEPMVDTFASIFHGALNSAGENVATASDREAASARVEAAIGLILTGLRSLVDQGADLELPTGQDS
ncbi:TetR/AcrR family transcriptional regulator [Nocardioides alcanivorans]|uniref:TetR/AcrR family transcriptional regulator n=1 Tax=Nocardioides alcanivorans TaxID=2897352 RepID=UPI001F2480B7|nr:TetR/AcrR family transcriptional regulator [Nocardioides alcanivorans]